MAANPVEPDLALHQSLLDLFRNLLRNPVEPDLALHQSLPDLLRNRDMHQKKILGSKKTIIRIKKILSGSKKHILGEGRKEGRKEGRRVESKESSKLESCSFTTLQGPCLPCLMSRSALRRTAPKLRAYWYILCGAVCATVHRFNTYCYILSSAILLLASWCLCLHT